ncbi:MAG TPA: 4Fe-4S binding protein [bacterium]|nr:4Fe-4S binding protein [bacterium]
MNGVKRIKCNREFCVSCGLCAVVCSLAHGDEIENFLFIDKNYKLRSRNKVARRDSVSFMNSCRNCKEPECLKACVAGAITKTETGIIKLDSKKCVGCWSCIMVCPNGAITAVETEKGEKYSIKCDLCENRESPACVDACPNKALFIEETE